MVEYYKGREIVFKALVGSHNYNLATPTSDKDYKVFVFPTFNDLYTGYSYKDSTIGEQFDYQVHDIRKLPELLAKSNVNFLEALFTTEIKSNHVLHTRLWSLRDSIARMNLPYLYDACVGMFNKEIKLYEKKMAEGNEAKAFKYAASAIRSTDFLYRFHNNDFSDFRAAIWYEDHERVLYKIKTGLYSREAVEYTLSTNEETAIKLKPVYKGFEFDADTADAMKYWIKRYVQENILEQLIEEDN